MMYKAFLLVLVCLQFCLGKHAPPTPAQKMEVLGLCAAPKTLTCNDVALTPQEKLSCDGKFELECEVGSLKAEVKCTGEWESEDKDGKTEFTCEGKLEYKKEIKTEDALKSLE